MEGMEKTALGVLGAPLNINDVNLIRYIPSWFIRITKLLINPRKSPFVAKRKTTYVTGIFTFCHCSSVDFR